MNESEALIELLSGLATDPRFGMLCILLLAASFLDIRSHTIPNRLTVGGIAVGLLYAAIVPFSMHTGFLWALAGCALGLLMLLPFYLMKAMGAGDVKLMAMVGAFVGPYAIVHIVITTFIVGGVAAIGFALARGATGRLLGNLRLMVLIRMAGGSVAAAGSATSIGKMPYAVSIAIAAISYLVARHIGYA
ncbi:MAG: prepilin peptidase [Paucimonas sp.]|jgi:prepilin peptidase CpaA|nr:prepilin peptidase [Paucimonas sp.]